MLEITICDDEKKLRNDLRHIAGTQLELSGLEYHITEAESGEELLRRNEERPADIIFLDIEMGGMNGMEAAKSSEKVWLYGNYYFCNRLSRFCIPWV